MAKGTFGNAAGYPRKGKGKAMGKFVLPAVPGDGKIVKPRGGVSPRSAAMHADDAQDAFGYGKAKAAGKGTF